MNILLDPQSIPPMGRTYGINTFASFDRIVNMLIKHGHIQLNDGEHIATIVVSAVGLTFQIESKT